jgi:hypothetical protein
VGTGAAKTKGLGFVNVRSFTVERYGEAGWAGVLAELLPEERRELESVVPVGWYSLALYARLIRALDKVHGASDLALVVQLGRYEAERDLTTIHRMLLRLANPAFMLDKTAEYWRRFHDTGEWTVERETKNRVRAHLDHWGVADAAMCRELGGYLVRVWELLGARHARVDHIACRARGDARCTFIGRWGEVEAGAGEGPPEARPGSPRSAPRLPTAGAVEPLEAKAGEARHAAEAKKMGAAPAPGKHAR